MTKWPNWLDLLLVCVLLRTCYSGFGRGLWSELLSLIGVVSATVIAVNFYEPVALWIGPWHWVGSTLTTFLVFAALFLGLVVALRVLIRRINELIKWEHMHWMTQGIGLILGGVRGLWWCGLIVLIMTASGTEYLRGSARDFSVLAPHLESIARPALKAVVDRMPGAREERRALIPPMKSGR